MDATVNAEEQTISQAARARLEEIIAGECPGPHPANTKAAALFLKISGCCTGVPVDAKNGECTGHWSETCFPGEMMAPESTDGVVDFIS